MPVAEYMFICLEARVQYKNGLDNDNYILLFIYYIFCSYKHSKTFFKHPLTVCSSVKVRFSKIPFLERKILKMCHKTGIVNLCLLNFHFILWKIATVSTSTTTSSTRNSYSRALIAISVRNVAKGCLCRCARC